MGCVFSRNNCRVPKVFRRRKTVNSKKYVVSPPHDGVYQKNEKLNSRDSLVTRRVPSVTPNTLYTVPWYTPDVAPSTLTWLMGAKDLMEDSIPELATYIKQNESELENDAKQGNDSDADRKNKAERDSKTTEEEIPSCLCYNGYHEYGFHWFTLNSSVLNETVEDMSLNCIPEAIASCIEGFNKHFIIVYKNTDNSTTYMSTWGEIILDRICSRFGNQLLRVVLYKPSWFLQMVVNEEKENFFSLSVTKKLKVTSDFKELATLTGFPGETKKLSRSC